MKARKARHEPLDPRPAGPRHGDCLLAGRPYRLFYSQKPTLGLCFIYDDTSAGGHDFKFYMVPLEQLQGAAPSTYRMFGGDVVKLQVSSDLSTLQITR